MEENILSTKSIIDFRKKYIEETCKAVKNSKDLNYLKAVYTFAVSYPNSDKKE